MQRTAMPPNPPKESGGSSPVRRRQSTFATCSRRRLIISNCAPPTVLISSMSNNSTCSKVFTSASNASPFKSASSFPPSLKSESIVDAPQQRFAAATPVWATEATEEWRPKISLAVVIAALAVCVVYLCQRCRATKDGVKVLVVSISELHAKLDVVYTSLLQRHELPIASGLTTQCDRFCHDENPNL